MPIPITLLFAVGLKNRDLRQLSPARLLIVQNLLWREALQRYNINPFGANVSDEPYQGPNKPGYLFIFEKTIALDTRTLYVSGNAPKAPSRRPFIRGIIVFVSSLGWHKHFNNELN